jgi:hypothetical protein
MRHLVQLTGLLAIPAFSACHRDRGGAVDFMRLQGSGDWKVQFRMTRNMSYYLDHIQPRSGLKIGDIVETGEVIGATSRGGRQGRQDRL